MICIFDIETIPDTELIRQYLHVKGNDTEVYEQAKAHYKAKTNSDFLPVPFHQVVSICAVMSDDFGRFERVNKLEGKDEYEMIKKFLNFLNKHNPKLVTYNGRAFDLPVLMIRAMKYSLTCSAYFETQSNTTGKSKWENYRQRYSQRFHIDLCDELSEYGALRGMNLDMLCSLIGAPGKYDVHGSQVFELHQKNELDKIHEYCESDVLNTYWLYLNYELLKGNITKNDYVNNLDIMKGYLLDNEDIKSYTKYFVKNAEKKIGEILAQ